MNTRDVSYFPSQLWDVLALIQRFAIGSLRSGAVDVAVVQQWTRGIDPQAGPAVVDCLEDVLVALDVAERFLSSSEPPLPTVAMPRDVKERRKRIFEIGRKFAEKASRRGRSTLDRSPSASWAIGQLLGLIETIVLSKGTDQNLAAQAMSTRVQSWGAEGRADVLDAAESLELPLAYLLSSDLLPERES